MADINTGDSVQTDPVSSFSFEGLHEQAMNYGAEGTPAAAEGSVEQAAPEAQAEAVEQPQGDESQNIDNASPATLAQLTDDQLVEVTVDGEVVQMPWKDAKGGVMRQAHYTRSMQQFRQEQQQFEAQRAALTQAQQEHQVLVNLLRDPQQLQQFIAGQYPQLMQNMQQLQQAQQQVDPDDIATVGQIQQAQQAYQQQMQQLQQQFVQQLAEREEALTRTIEDRQEVAKLSADINTTVKGLFSEHPYLEKLVPNAEQVLRYEVLQLQPQTPQETLEAFKTVFGGWVENFKSITAETNKSAAIQKHKLTSNNIQPPGGAPPQQAPQTFKKVNKMTGKTEVDWDALRGVSLGMLDNK